MKKLEIITLLFFSGALACLVYKGVPSPWGIAIAILLLLFAVIYPVLHKSIQGKYPNSTKQIKIPLLCYVILSLLGTLLTIKEGKSELTPVYILFALGGVFGMISWIIERGYNKPVKQLWQEDLYVLSWEAEIVVILIFLVAHLRSQEQFTWSSVLIMVLALLDIVNQFIMKKLS